MAQLFKPAANTLALASIYVGAATPVLLLVLGSIITRSPWGTKATVPLDQPVPFSHKHHAWELGIDCRYCHSSVEKTAQAGIPSTQVCMSCHSQIWTNSPMLDPVRTSYAKNEPLRWNKVNNVPQFVYFDHSIHVARGINCNNCHGAVQKMHITWKGKYFSMQWCLECHRQPQNYLYKPEDGAKEPRQAAFDLYGKIIQGEKLNEVERNLAQGGEQKLTAGLVPSGIEHMKAMGVKTEQLADCWTCHR